MLRTINAETLKTMMEGAKGCAVINVLERSAFENEHICGSINIPLKEIEKDAVKLIAKDENVVVHCSGPSCDASKTAGEKLSALGYKNVMRFKGGMEEWKKAGLCLEGLSIGRKAA